MEMGRVSSPPFLVALKRLSPLPQFAEPIVPARVKSGRVRFVE
jgi:hypothetical protein